MQSEKRVGKQTTAILLASLPELGKLDNRQIAKFGRTRQEIGRQIYLYFKELAQQFGAIVGILGISGENSEIDLYDQSDREFQPMLAKSHQEQKPSFPSKDALCKSLFLGIQRLERKWISKTANRSVIHFQCLERKWISKTANRSVIHFQFQILFNDRLNVLGLE